MSANHGACALRTQTDVAGLPLLIRAADGRTSWTFIDAPHIHCRAHLIGGGTAVEAPAALAAQMEAHGHLVLDGVLPPPVVNQIGSYIRRLHADNELQPGEQYEIDRTRPARRRDQNGGDIEARRFKNTASRG